MAILMALAAEPGTWRYGYELVTGLGMNSGSLYPILMRLPSGDCWTRCGRPIPSGRPPRHMYRLTAAGVDYARAWAASAVPMPARLRPQGA